MHHEAEVEFDEPQAREQEREAIPPSKSITLEITPPKQGEAEIWNCYEVTSLQVTISNNEITSILETCTCKVLGYCLIFAMVHYFTADIVLLLIAFLLAFIFMFAGTH